MLPEDSLQFGKWPDRASHMTEWMEDARRIAVASYRQVLEDGPDARDSESDSDHSDIGEMGLPSEMYTHELVGSDGTQI
jgi:hypothetical protein